MAITELIAHAATDRTAEPRVDPAGRRRLQRRLPPRPPVQPLRARPVPRTGRDGLRPVLAGTGQRRRRAVPDRRHRRRRRLGHADPLPRAAVPARRHPPRAGIRPQAAGHRLGGRGHHPHPARLDRRPRPDPVPGHRPGVLHPPGHRHLRPGRPPETLPAVAARPPPPGPPGRPAAPATAGTGTRTARRLSRCPPSPAAAAAAR